MTRVKIVVKMNRLIERLNNAVIVNCRVEVSKCRIEMLNKNVVNLSLSLKSWNFCFIVKTLMIVDLKKSNRKLIWKRKITR